VAALRQDDRSASWGGFDAGHPERQSNDLHVGWQSICCGRRQWWRLLRRVDIVQSTELGGNSPCGRREPLYGCTVVATSASTRVMKTKIAVLALIPAAAGVVFCSSARAKRPVPSQQAPATSSTESTQSVWDGIYTPEQANRGETLYAQRCARCHGPDLGGGEIAPALNSAEFKSNWYGLSVDDLLERIKVSMPQNDPGSLSRQQTADILAFVLSKNGFPRGTTELAREAEVLKTIRFEANKPEAAGVANTAHSLASETLTYDHVHFG